MGQVGADINGADGVKFADLDLRLAPGSLQKNQARTPAAFAPTDLRKPEDIPVKSHGLFEIMYTVARVEKLGDHDRQQSLKRGKLKGESYAV